MKKGTAVLSIRTRHTLRLLLYFTVITTMSNVNALTDLFLSPDLPYFNLEHLVVGGIMALLTSIICAMVEVNISRSGKRTAKVRMAPFAWFIAIAWTIILFSSLVKDISSEKETSLDIARQEAKTVYEKDLNYYRWATGHHGVFVPITDKTQPNPYLDHLPEQVVVTKSGLKLTLVNPEYMIRQVYEMRAKSFEALGHITSLDPIRAENAADPWEEEALNAFESGSREVSSIESINGQPYLRLMRPMITEQGCLKCHAPQGYEPGDIRGGISVSIPMAHLYELARKKSVSLIFGHLSLWLLGILGIFIGSYRIQQSIGEREEAEAKVRSIIENMFDGLIILAEDATIESVNSPAAKMFGYESAIDSLLGEDIAILAPSITTSGNDQGSPAGIRKILGSLQEITGRKKDSTEFPVEMSVSEMKFGAHIFFIAVVRDITEEKIRKAEALQAGKLAAIGELAAGVAHEINNPINGVINYAQIIYDECESEGHKESLDLLAKIIKEGERVAGIVSNLLAFARQQDEENDEIKLREIIDDSISLLKHQLNKDGIQLVIETDENLPLLHGNPQQLQQVFLNLISNARYALNERYKKVDPGKRIEIKTELVNLGTDYLRTTVTDYGVGIPPELVSRIFDSLFSTKPPGEGTGLGLSISRELVHAHKGHLHIESQLNDHTTAIVDLPLPESKPPETI